MMIKNTLKLLFLSITLFILLLEGVLPQIQTQLLALENGSNITTTKNEEDQTYKPEAKKEKVTICHRTSSDTNPYIVLTVDESSVDGEGKNDHTHHITDENNKYGDIIPLTDQNNDNTLTVEDCLIFAGINITPPPTPDFSVFVNCIDINNDATFTAYFGYLNNLETEQVMDESRISPDQYNTGTAPQNLETGRHDKLFSITAANEEIINWIATAAPISKTATASINSTICDNGQDEDNGDDDNDDENDDDGDEDNGDDDNDDESDDGDEDNGDDDNDDESDDGDDDGDDGDDDNDDNEDESDDESDDENNESNEEEEKENLTIEEQPITAIQRVLKLTNETPMEVTYPLEINPASFCSNGSIYIDKIPIETDKDIISFEYSYDGGNTWLKPDYILGLGTKEIEIGIETPTLEEGLYRIQFKAQSASGETIKSQYYPYLHDCGSTTVILSNYIQNGFGHGILTTDGSVLYNTSLEGILYVETIGAIADLELILAPTKEELTSSTHIYPLEYDENTQIWSLQLPNEYISLNDTTFGVINYGFKNLEKEIPPIINISNQTEDTNTTGFKYEVYRKNGDSWDKYPYDEYNNELENNIPDNKFNLPPGEYFIKTDYPDTRTYYSERFSINNYSIVQVITDKTSDNGLLQILDPFIRDLDVVIYSRSNSPTESPLTTEDIKKIYMPIFDQIKNQKNDDEYILGYWTRWNPYYSEQLNLLEKESEKENSQVILFTDPRNFNELTNILQARDSKIIALEITDLTLLDKPTIYSPEYIKLNTEGDISVYRGLTY